MIAPAQITLSISKWSYSIAVSYRLTQKRNGSTIQIVSNAPVAQLDRALPSGGRGQRFESSRVRHPYEHPGPVPGFLFGTPVSVRTDKRFDNFRQEVGPSRSAAQSRREQNGHQPF